MLASRRRKHNECVHNSKPAFTRMYAANDPQEINDSIKQKNPLFTQAWPDALTLINR